MNRRQQWVLASNNAGKLNEFAHLLAPLNIDIKPQRAFSVVDAEETGLSFIENALIKARHAASITKLPALSDDSGLSVDALAGEPGIYSARYASRHQAILENVTVDESNIQCLLSKMNHQVNRQARFYCVLAFVRHEFDPTPIIAQGVWTGSILEQSQGEQGFGYDPIFYVPERGCSAAELSAEEKAALSHRGHAVQQFMTLIQQADL